jgi:hypothetical protein
MKNSILILIVLLITCSCAEQEKSTFEDTNVQTITDTIKINPVSQNTETAADTADEVADAFQNTPPVPIVGSWDDVDPADPGPGSQSLTLEANGACNISEQEGGYNGTWSYDPVNGILNLKLSHINGSGEMDSEVDNDYKIEEMTEGKIKITDLSNRYPQLGGSFWKNNAQ